MIDPSDYSDFTNRDLRSMNTTDSLPRNIPREGQVKTCCLALVQGAPGTLHLTRGIFFHQVRGRHLSKEGRAADTPWAGHTPWAAEQFSTPKKTHLHRFAKSIGHMNCGPGKVLKFSSSLEPAAQATPIPISPPPPLQSSCRDGSNHLSHA